MKVEDFNLDSFIYSCAAIYYPYRGYFPNQDKSKEKKGDQMLETFTKDMLKPGMLVECRDGGLRKLGYNSHSSKVDLFKEDGMYLQLNKFNDDLIYVNKKEYTVVRVYVPKQTEDSFSFDLSHHELIWERPEPKLCLTHDQIAEKLGIKPEKLVIVCTGLKYGNGCWTKE